MFTGNTAKYDIDCRRNCTRYTDLYQNPCNFNWFMNYSFSVGGTCLYIYKQNRAISLELCQSQVTLSKGSPKNCRLKWLHLKRRRVDDIVLAYLLLTLNIFHALFYYFHCWLWTRKCQLSNLTPDFALFLWLHFLYDLDCTYFWFKFVIASFMFYSKILC